MLQSFSAKDGCRLTDAANAYANEKTVGGSVIDCCKIVSAQTMPDEDIWEMGFAKMVCCHWHGPMWRRHLQSYHGMGLSFDG